MGGIVCVIGVGVKRFEEMKEDSEREVWKKKRTEGSRDVRCSEGAQVRNISFVSVRLNE
jgi:hypothetical protein